MLKRFWQNYYERHAIALLLVCYGIVLLDPRSTTGVTGFMLQNYSRHFVWILGTWAFLGAIFLISRRAYPVTMIVASVPILAYTVMGAWFVTHTKNAPIAAFFIHLGVYLTVLFLVGMRIRAMARGYHADDDSIPTRPN